MELDILSAPDTLGVAVSRRDMKNDVARSDTGVDVREMDAIEGVDTNPFTMVARARNAVKATDFILLRGAVYWAIVGVVGSQG